MAPLGRRRSSKGPRFGALSVVGVGIRAVSEPGYEFRCAGDICSVREVGARSSNSRSAGLRSRVNVPWNRRGSSAPDTVRGQEMCPVGAREKITMIWGVGSPSPAEEGI
jgi:hypothetical protein